MYPMYTSPLFQIADNHGVLLHMYADDTQLYLSFSVNDSAQAMEKLQNCIADIRKWMRDSHLNDTKTEFLVIGNISLTNNCMMHHLLH